MNGAIGLRGFWSRLFTRGYWFTPTSSTPVDSTHSAYENYKAGVTADPYAAEITPTGYQARVTVERA